MIQLLLLLIFSQPLYAHLHGYTKLVQPETGRIVELLFDSHTIEPVLSKDAPVIPYKELIPQLLPTEQELLRIMRHLDTPYADIAFICETSKTKLFGTPCFLGNVHRLLVPQLVYIPFIYADEWRRDERGLISYLLLGRSPTNWMDIEAVRTVSGSGITEAFQSFVAEKTKRIQQYSGSLILTPEELTTLRTHFTNHPIPCHDCPYRHISYANIYYASLADIELLYHLLSCPMSRIIVYAGGLHCKTLGAFLCDHAGYTVTHNYITGTYTDELFVSLLAPLEGREVSPFVTLLHYLKKGVSFVFGNVYENIVAVLIWYWY